jgi:hypothetical protein
VSAYTGVGNRRTQEELLQLQQLPTELSNDPQFDAGDDGDQTCKHDGNSTKKMRVRGYHSSYTSIKNTYTPLKSHAAHNLRMTRKILICY